MRIEEQVLECEHCQRLEKIGVDLSKTGLVWVTRQSKCVDLTMNVDGTCVVTSPPIQSPPFVDLRRVQQPDKTLCGAPTLFELLDLVQLKMSDRDCTKFMVDLAYWFSNDMKVMEGVADVLEELV
jgi:hypothetical protein